MKILDYKKKNELKTEIIQTKVKAELKEKAHAILKKNKASWNDLIEAAIYQLIENDKKTG